MDENCARCGAPTTSPRELHRFGTGGVVSETVCEGCCTRLEQAVSRRVTDDADLQAFILSLVDGFEAAHAALALTRRG